MRKASDGKWTTNRLVLIIDFSPTSISKARSLRRLKSDLYLTQITHFLFIRQQVEWIHSPVNDSPSRETILSSWKAQLSPVKLENVESLTYVEKWKKKLELFTLKNRKQMCWRENEARTFLHHRQSRMIPLECRQPAGFNVDSHRTCARKNARTLSNLIPLEPRKFSPVWLQKFFFLRDRRLTFQLVTVDHQANCRVNSRRLEQSIFAFKKFGDELSTQYKVTCFVRVGRNSVDANW